MCTLPPKTAPSHQRPSSSRSVFSQRSRGPGARAPMSLGQLPTGRGAPTGEGATPRDGARGPWHISGLDNSVTKANRLDARAVIKVSQSLRALSISQLSRSKCLVTWVFLVVKLAPLTEGCHFHGSLPPRRCEGPGLRPEKDTCWQRRAGLVGAPGQRERQQGIRRATPPSPH